MKNKIDTDVIKGLVAVGSVIFISAICGVAGIRIEEKVKAKYNQILLEEVSTKRKLIDFYKNHGLEKYIVYESPLNTTKTLEEHIKLLDVPYEEIKRIVKGEK